MSLRASGSYESAVGRPPIDYLPSAEGGNSVMPANPMQTIAEIVTGIPDGSSELNQPVNHTYADRVYEREKRQPKSESEHRGGYSENEIIEQYFYEANQFPLLTKEDEIELAQKIEAAKATKSELGEEVDATDSAELRRVILDGEVARNRFINSNLKLVLSIALRYKGRGVSYADLIQEGNIGLMRAVEMFDWQKGFKFSTYATWWIRRFIQDAIDGGARTIRPAKDFNRTLYKVRSTQQYLEDKYYRSVSLDEISAECDLTLEKVKEAYLYDRKTVSLNTPLTNETTDELADTIGDEKATEAIDRRVNSIFASGVITKLFECLSSRERLVLEETILKNRSLESVGGGMGVTKERVRQLRARALNKLRQSDLKYQLRELLD